MRIVGLVGPKRSGKTTAAEVLVRERGFVSIGFADALKELALKVNPDLAADVQEFGWEVAKGLSNYRWFLQALGTDGIRAIDPNFWINAWADKAVGYLRDIVVPDVRFANEAEYLRKNGALLIRIGRPGLDDSDQHISETEQLGIECDVEIENRHIDTFRADVLAEVDTFL